ncbi:MAG: hypothetical protein Q7T55_21190, partial [Solirubrobacteraceae bacterium]|nr:hypothetical protein [Solirubrobacteraceae bacterium]
LSISVALDAPSSVAVTIVDDDLIDTEITSGPEGASNVNTPTFTFVATPAAGATFQCWIDAAPPKACNDGSFAPGKIVDGSHTFTVRAVSPEGETDRSPATRTFFVDTASPDVYVSFGGFIANTAERTYAGQATMYAYANDYVPASGLRDVRCVIDPPSKPVAFSDFPLPCSDPVVVSAIGTHTAYAAAVDQAGNLGISGPATAMIVPVPRTYFESGPIGTVFSSLHTFTFGATVAGSTFTCSLDGAKPMPCASPWKLPVLKPGSHYVQIYATSPQGFADPYPPQQSFTINAGSTKTVGCKIEPLEVGTGSQRCVFEPTGQPPQPCGGVNLCTQIPACPVGSLCKLKVTAQWKNADDADWRVVIGASGAGNLAASSAASGVCGASGKSGRGCSASVEWSYLSDVGFAPWCGPLATPKGASAAKDASRSLTCTATITVSPASALVGAANASGITTFAPGAGTVTATTGTKGASGARLATATATAARAPKKAKSKKKTKPLFSATTVRAPAAGNVRLGIKLSKEAKATLKKKGKLVLPVTLTFKPDGGGAPTVVTKTYTVYPAVKNRALPKAKGK